MDLPRHVAPERLHAECRPLDLTAEQQDLQPAADRLGITLADIAH